MNYISNNYSSQDVKNIRDSLGLTTRELAELCGVSKRTVERWESGDIKVNGTASRLLYLLYTNSQTSHRLIIPDMPFDLRILVYKDEPVKRLVTIIDVNEIDRYVKIRNYTDCALDLPFASLRPTYQEYNQFIESFVGPRPRDAIFYDPIHELQNKPELTVNGFRLVVEEKNI